jgi:hypothetical protein
MTVYSPAKMPYVRFVLVRLGVIAAVKRLPRPTARVALSVSTGPYVPVESVQEM